MSRAPSSFTFGSVGSRAPAFDGAASSYDATFSDRHLGRLLRGLLHEELARHLPSHGVHLELGCGTGVDALWLARQGAAVVATDGSALMLDATSRRVAAAAERQPLAGSVAVAALDLSLRTPPSMARLIAGDPSRLLDRFRVAVPGDYDRLEVPGDRGGADDPAATGSEGFKPVDAVVCAPRTTDGRWHGAFDGCYSSFGPVNCVLDRRPLAAALLRWLRPGARLCLVTMSRLAPWDWLWYGAHLRPRAAARRLRRRAWARLPGGGTLALDYPSARTLDAELGPGFRRIDHRALGALLPISEAAGLVDRAPLLFQALADLEHAVAHRRPLPWLCDHALHVWERR